MHGLKLEHRPLPDKTYLTKDIASHIAKEQSYKTTVIIADHPKQMLALISQEWSNLLEDYKQQKELTDDNKLKEKLGYRIAYMQNREIRAESPGEVLKVGITIATPKDFLRFTPACQRMYVVSNVTQEQLYMLTAWMFEGGRVVDYRFQSKNTDNSAERIRKNH